MENNGNSRRQAPAHTEAGNNKTASVPAVRPRKKRSKTGTTVLILAIAAGAAVLGTVIFFMASLFLYKPPVDVNPPPVTEPSVTGTPTVTDASGSEVTTAASSDPAVFTRNTKKHNILVVGSDNEDYLTDTMMIVNIDETTGKVSIVQFPRDTHVYVNEHYRRINTLYSHFLFNSTSVSDSFSVRRKQAMALVCDTLEYNLNIRIDYYVKVSLSAFTDIVDSIGGVYIDVPIDMDYEDSYQDLYIHLKKGYQKLNGDQAEQFVRFRSDYIEGDVGRIDAQKLFLTAFLSALRQNFDITKIPAIYNSVISNLITDMTVLDVEYYGKIAIKTDMANLALMTMPGGSAQNPDTGAWYYIMSRSSAYKIISTYLNVFNETIPESTFDIDRVFCNKTNQIYIDVYNSVIDTIPVYYGNNINDTINLWVG